MGHINNIETSFILDSGATISVINSEQVINSSNSLIETKNIRVHTANGSILKVIGKMEIDIAFKNWIFPTQFVLVSNLAGPALLGTDFLSKYRVQLDFFNKEIVIYKNITNKITFTFKPKRDILSSCTIVEDSVKQNEQSKETHENKIEINIDNNSENDVNLSGQNENIILLEKLAKQINDTDKKFPPFHQIKPKINKLEINNVTLYETKKYIESDKINDTYELLNKSIISLASKFVKLENVPSDGNCGVHALVKILNNEQINVNFKQITDLLKITKYKTPIWLEAEDLAAVINHYNLNLIVIQETLTSDNNSTVLAYYKSGRKCVSVFYNLNHWTPGVLSNEINTAVINSVVIYDFPSLKSRHSVLHSRYKCNDRLGGENIYNISNNADIMHNHYRPIVNSKKLDNISPDIACENFDINPDLTNKQKGDLIQLLNKYKNIFSQSKWDLGEVDTDPIEIKLSDKTPVNLRNFKLSLSEIKEIEKQTKDLLEAGIIEHSTSAYSSPIFLVPKGQPQGTKNKTASEYRMVLDYRRVNEKTLKEAFPLPIIQNIYDSLAGNKYFSCLDAMSGFHQLKLNDNSKEITSFSTSTGHYQFTRLPFGLTNAPQNFQKVMNKIMAGLTYRINCCYLDDCVCFGKTFEEHLNALEITFERLLKYKLKLKISKCKFGYTEIKLLGNIINGQGIKPTEEGLLAIRNFPSPTTIKQLRSFLGLANYFRRFIPNFSKLAHPLTELTKGKFKSKKSIIPWSETQEIAFKNLKLKLTNKPVLSHFNDNAEIILVTDGSKKGLGVILQQINENHEIHPVAYASKKLNTAQNNYSALELEMAALHFGCIHFRQYLHGRTFTVWTDHKNLIQLQTIKSESTILNRLRTKLIGFDFKIIYKKGIFNQAADFLSRYPIENNVITTNLNEHQINIVEPVNLKILQARDNYLKNIITVLENSEIVDIKWKNKAKSYTLNNKNGLIYYKEKINGHPKLVLAIPEILTNEVIQNFHDNKMSGAHLGVHKVYNKIRTRYHWPLMHKQIKAYVTSCIHCQKRKPDKSKQVGKMLTYPIESGIPFSDVTIDYVGPLMPSRGFRYILVATCRVTKYCVAKACRNADAKSTTAFLLDLLLSYGAMKVVRSDNGTHFTAKVISDILTALNIKKTEGIAYRPTSQGGVEKQNQVIIDMIAPYMQNNEKWSDVLQIVLHAYNSAIHYSTGYSPFYLLHGYEPSSIFDIAVIPNSLEHSVIEELNKLQKVRNTIPEILKKAFENQKMNTDKNRSDIDFKVGEQVLVKIPIRKHKFSDRYDGPYPIIKKLNTNSYLIKLPKNVGSFEKWAFGILNENDLIEIDEKIKAHTGRNKMTLDLINIQTRIVQSTLNNFNNITNTINENTIKLKTTLEQLICDVNNSVHNIQKIDVSQTLTQHLIFFNIILTEFNQETEELIESIVWGQNQQLHPSIINPNTIINQLKEIEKILPKQLSIPQSPEKINNFLDFLKLLTISLNFMDTYLIYTIYIPLCELDNYVIYHITPFPVPIKNNNYIFIKPSNEYLAISQDNEKFVIFTHQDYMMCKHSLDITICNPHNIIIRNTHDTCEVQLFIDPLNLPVSCDVRHIKTSITFYKKLILKNSWIYASGQSNIVTLVCPDNSKTIKLLGTGILSINEACYVTTPTTILKPNNCYANMTTNIDFVPQFHITNVSTNLMNKINKIQEPTITIPVLKTIDNQLSDISKSSNSLDSVINMIEIEEESIKKGDVFN
ncbi:hypothetical protein QTP88_011286 [Uroleucon formosanum]